MKFHNEFLNFIFESWPYLVGLIPCCVGVYKSIKVEKIIAANKELVSTIQARAPITQEHYNQLLDVFSNYLDNAARFNKSDLNSILKEYRSAYLKSRMLIPDKDLHDKMDEVNTYLLDQKNSNIKSELEFTNMLADISDSFSLFLNQIERNK
ncbi:hypothetical protein [Holdemanella biformis]